LRARNGDPERTCARQHDVLRPRGRLGPRLALGSDVSIAVYDSDQQWGGKDRGIQAFGKARALHGREAREAVAVYGRRFENDEHILGRFVAYRFRPTRLKLFDERMFGGGTFVTARVGRDGMLAWERTETYREVPTAAR